MKAKLNNATHIEGRLYQHNLVKKISGEKSKNPGTEFITGTIDIATDEDVTNIVSVHFTYECEYNASTKKKNTRWDTLNAIINGQYKTVMEFGADNATLFKIDSAIGLNEFYSDRSGKEELVSVKRNEGGFIHVVPTLAENEELRSTFDTDIVITNVRHIEADDEKKTPEKAIIKGAIFNFRKELLPVEFSVLNPNAIAYFEDLGATASAPVFTRIKGEQISTNIVRTIVEESAFGADSVREVTSSHKDYVVTWAQKDPYEWDSEDSITAQEFSEAIKAREITIATLKKNQEEWKNNSGNAIDSTPAPAKKAPAKDTEFKF